MRFAVQGLNGACVWEVVHRPIGQPRRRLTMDRISSWHHVWQPAFVSHCIVLMRWLMVAICEYSQAILRLGCGGARPANLVGCGRRRPVGIRFGDGIEVLLLEGAGAPLPMAATAILCRRRITIVRASTFRMSLLTTFATDMCRAGLAQGTTVTTL